MPDAPLVLYEKPAPGVCRLVLNRPDKRNAQNTDMLCALNGNFDRAAADDEVRIIILAANGPDFSAGHDLKEEGREQRLERLGPKGPHGGVTRPGQEGMMAYEAEIYLGYCERWRALPKPTIAEVQGRCIAGGLMLAWACDLIVAGRSTQFLDNTLAMGIPGVEFFVHPWELGFRKAKEYLFTADWITADEAYRLGMVNHVVDDDDLSAFTLRLANRIAEKSPFALKLAKEAVNTVQDAQGRAVSQKAVFALHHLAHSHWRLIAGQPLDPSFRLPKTRQ